MRAGIEHVFVIEFNDRIQKSYTEADLLKNLCCRRWNVGHIVAGYDHSFGKDRAGDHESLISMGREYGFGVDIVQPVIMNDQVVSSTAIRRLIMEGDMPLANAMLGRKFSLTGRVVQAVSDADAGWVVQRRI